MTGLEGLLADPNTIETMAGKSEGLMKGLFGKAFSEVGEMIADNIRYRRAKNQVNIFEKAKKFLNDKGVKSEIEMDLKVLAPLLQNCSLEENEDLQDLWSKLITNVLSRPTPIVLQQNAISILNKISNQEVLLLNSVYNALGERRIKSLNQYYNQWTGREMPIEREKTIDDFRIDIYAFKIKEMASAHNLSADEMEIQISNLVALGTLKYELEVDVLSAYKPYEDDDDVDIELDVTDYNSIRMTKLGYAFVELCTIK